MANIKKNAKGYNYTYTDLAAVNDYIESIGETYTQEVTTLDGIDYILTNRKDKDGAITILRGCCIVQAALGGKSNAAQEQGSGVTYARRYSLLMAYGLATEDDDGESFTRTEVPKVIRNRTEEIAEATNETLARAKASIKAQLIKQDYADADQMQAFIKSVIGKDTINNLNDADSVADALDNEL